MVTVVDDTHTRPLFHTESRGAQHRTAAMGDTGSGNWRRWCGGSGGLVVLAFGVAFFEALLELVLR